VSPEQTTARNVVTCRMTDASSAHVAIAARIDWIDYARGIGIVLVVIGHVLRGLTSADVVPRTELVLRTDAWIYAFHMPLFFVLSGLFAPKSLDRPTASFLADKLRTIAYPYLVWSVLQSVVQIALSRYANHPVSPASLLGIAYEPVMQFWFLYALFVILVALHAMRRIGLSYTAILAVTIGLAIVESVVDLRFTVARSAAHFAPYVALGAAAYETVSARLAALTRSTLAFGVLALFACVTAGVFAGVTGIVWAAPAFALAGTTASLMLAALIAAFARSDGRARTGVSWLARLGQESLPIYVAHTLASAGTRIVLLRVLHVDSPIVHVVAGTVFGLAFPMMLVALCRRIGFRYAFAWPRR